MDFYKLKYFISVARHLSFTRAAEECHVAQTVMSRQIASLEEELGVQLLYRNNRQVELTPAGILFYDESVYMLQYYYGALERTKKTAVGYKGALKIGVGPYEMDLLPGKLLNITEHYPEISVNCMQFSYGIMPFRFTRGLVDVAFCSKKLATRFDNSVLLDVYPNYWLLAAHKDHEFWQLPKERRQTLDGQVLIVLEDDLDDEFKYSCSQCGCRVKEYSKTNFYNTQLLMLQGKIGIAFLPGFLKTRLPECIRTEEARNLPFLYSFICAYMQENHNPCIKTFLDASF